MTDYPASGCIRIDARDVMSKWADLTVVYSGWLMHESGCLGLEVPALLCATCSVHICLFLHPPAGEVMSVDASHV